MAETMCVDGTNVEVRIDSRKYPGTTYRWGYWRFEGEGEWRYMGDPWCGAGATAALRKEVERQVRIELKKSEVSATPDVEIPILQPEPEPWFNYSLKNEL